MYTKKRLFARETEKTGHNKLSNDADENNSPHLFTIKLHADSSMIVIRFR